MTTTETRKRTPVCVNCGERVKAINRRHPARPHGGHVDAALNRTCGTWGWRYGRVQQEG